MLFPWTDERFSDLRRASVADPPHSMLHPPRLAFTFLSLFNIELTFSRVQVLLFTGREPGTMHKLGIGAFAGLVAQSCTYPLEVVRRRMQTHGLVDTHAGVRKVRKRVCFTVWMRCMQQHKGTAPPMSQQPDFECYVWVDDEMYVVGFILGSPLSWSYSTRLSVVEFLCSIKGIVAASCSRVKAIETWIQ